MFDMIASVSLLLFWFQIERPMPPDFKEQRSFIPAMSPTNDATPAPDD